METWPIMIFSNNVLKCLSVKVLLKDSWLFFIFLFSFWISFQKIDYPDDQVWAIFVNEIK